MQPLSLLKIIFFRVILVTEVLIHYLISVTHSALYCIIDCTFLLKTNAEVSSMTQQFNHILSLE